MQCFVRRSLLPAAVSLALAFSGCSSEAPKAPEKKEEKKAAPAPVTGQSALFSIYQAARQWSGDVKILDIENIPLDSVKTEPGKYGAWRAVLASPGKSQKRVFTYSVIEESAVLHEGVFAQGAEPYVANPTERSFFIQDVKIDTPAALETAKKQADTKTYEKKNPDTPVQYRLEWTGQTVQPAWRVIWGRSVSTSGYSVYVSAVDGAYLKEAR